MEKAVNWGRKGRIEGQESRAFIFFADVLLAACIQMDLSSSALQMELVLSSVTGNYTRDRKISYLPLLSRRLSHLKIPSHLGVSVVPSQRLNENALISSF
jgi:hypothetical protein